MSAAVVGSPFASPRSSPSFELEAAHSERLLIFDPDSLLRALSQGTAGGLACEVQLVTSLVDLAAAGRAAPPTAALLGGDVKQAAGVLRAQPGCSHIPFAALAAAPSLDETASALDAGAQLCLSAPIEMDVLRWAVETLRNPGDGDRPRVLVVDELASGDELAALLVEDGMAASVLDDPRDLLLHLETLEPDALILDVELPGLGGIELCRALRALPRWRNLPILLVAGFTGEDTRRRAYGAGADDCLQWPLVGDEVAALLRSRIERARQLLEFSDRDSLTGLLNRRAFLEAFHGRLADASRHERPLTLGLIDLDHFKEVNDLHGHLAGDRVLAGAGRHLGRRLRIEDLRGRWGGEELVLALPGETLESAHRVVDRLRAEFSAMTFVADSGETFRTSFSGGLVALPRGGATIEQLVRVADERLYRAKREGRNRVISASA